MNAVWIGFDRYIDISKIHNFIKKEFGIKNCYKVDSNSIGLLLKRLGLNDITENENIVFYEIKENNSEFPLVIEFLYLKDLPIEMKINIYIAHKLSILFKCKTITDGVGFGDDNSEYWDIIFDKGIAYLADDLETLFYGDGDKKLKIVRKIDVCNLF